MKPNEALRELKDKLEVGLKPDAPYRRSNLPEFQQDDPACQLAGEPGDSEELREARDACAHGDGPDEQPRKVRAGRSKRSR
jgi:hypothetical protein